MTKGKKILEDFYRKWSGEYKYLKSDLFAFQCLEEPKPMECANSQLSVIE